MFTKKLHDPAEVVRLQSRPHVEYVLVTPEIAAAWLESNNVNRHLRERRVTQYARDMAAGRWTLNADMICFGTNGDLLNGQHRLNAVVSSGTTVMFAVQYDTPAEAMQNMDTGSARTAGDYLAWQGETHRSLLASVVKQTILWESGRIYQDNHKQTVSTGEITQFIAANPDIRTTVETVDRMRKNIDAAPTALGCAHWAIAQVSGMDDADEFFARLGSLAEESKGSPILAVNSRLREIRRNRVKVSTRELVAMFIKAWNYDVNGRTVATISLGQRGTFRIPEPARRTK